MSNMLGFYEYYGLNDVVLDLDIVSLYRKKIVFQLISNSTVILIAEKFDEQ
jgi:hypothetical protein